MSQIITAKEVAEYLKLSESTIYKLASNGEIPGFRIGDSWRFDMADVLDSIENYKRVIRPGLDGKKGVTGNNRYSDVA